MGKHYDFQQLADGVMLALALNEGEAASNGGIIDLGDRTIVFDSSNSRNSGRELRAAAEDWTGRSPAILINSHGHGDHVFGNEIFADIPIVSTATTREFMDTSTRPAALESENVQQFTLPTLTFTGELAFYGSARSAKLICFGGGHTPSDSILFLPDSGIIFIADLIFNGFHPFIGHGNPDNNISMLDQIKLLAAGCYVPGHGPDCGVDQLDFMQHYLRTLRGIVAEVKAAGGSEADAQAVPIPDEFSHLFNFGTMYESTMAKLYNHPG